MQKIKYLLVVVACLGLGSCGIFKKGCGCPTFGKAKNISPVHATSPQA